MKRTTKAIIFASFILIIFIILFIISASSNEKKDKPLDSEDSISSIAKNVSLIFMWAIVIYLTWKITKTLWKILYSRNLVY